MQEKSMSEQSQSQTPKTDKQDRQLSPGRLQGQEFVMTRHCVTLEEGTTLEDIKDSAFWAHVAPRLKPYDQITVRTDDGLWWAELLVLVVGRTFAKVKVLQHVPLSTTDVDMSVADKIEGYEVKYRGPLCEWSVLRTKDGQLLSEKHKTKGHAQAWLNEHLKVVS